MQTAETQPRVTTVFLDRDGVINRKPAVDDYVKCWEEFEFLPGAIEAIGLLKQHGFRVIVVTNQRGISTGRFTEEALRVIHKKMEAQINRSGPALDAIYYCPHDNNSCNCRKPETGLFLRAQRDFHALSFVNSFMIGDSASDMEAAQRLGCQKILIGTDAKLISALERAQIQIDYFAPSLLEAVRKYLLPQVLQK